MYSQIWLKYKNYFLKHLNGLRKPKSEGLPYLRDKLFISILLITFPLGLLVYIPSVIFALFTGELFIIFGDTIAILTVGFILFYKNHSLLTKKILFSVNLYVLACVLLLFLGTKGPGIILFISFSILSTLYISKKAGLISVAIIAVTYFFLLLGFSIRSSNLLFFNEFYTISGDFHTSSWLVIIINLIAFNTILILAVSFLVDHLQNSILTEHKLQNQLKKESKELLDAKLKSEESDRLKSAFLANMSHEIRTPMNGILGFTNLLKQPNLTGQIQQKYIEIIEKAGGRLLNTIQEILDISIIESGEMKVNKKETNINEKVEYVYNLLKLESAEKRIQLSFNNSLPEIKAITITDGEKLIAMLTNLVKNAIKYTEKGSIKFGYKLKGNFLIFYVEDTGIGIPENRVNAIFDRFTQADIADIEARQGAGLGLSISKAYAEILGGKIWVESELGTGSKFYFSIPYLAKTDINKIVKKNNTVQNEGNHIKDLKILIAEDDETSEILISIIVDKYSKEVFKAKTGYEAVDICRANTDIDLILMDIQMPELNGFDATQQIRQFNKDVVIIAQTAFGLSGDREKSIKAGCNDYISKPVIKDELIALIEKYFTN